MAALTAITIKDSAGSDVVFQPDFQDGNTVRWVYKPFGKSMNEWVYITFTRQLPANKSSGATVGAISIELPVADPVTKLVVSTNRETEKFTIPVKADPLVNKNMAAFAKNLNALAVTQAFREDGSLPLS